MHDKKRVEETHVCMFSSITYCSATCSTFVVTRHSRYVREARACKSREVSWPTYVHSCCVDLWVCSETETVRSDFSIPAAHGPEIVTIGLIVRQ